MRYKQYIIKKFITTIIKRGLKNKSIKYFLNILSSLKKENKTKPINLLIKSIYNVKPSVFYKKLRRGSKFIYLPKVLTKEEQIKQGIYWLIDYARKQKKNNNNVFLNQLNKEIIEALNKEGKAYRKKKKIYYLLIDSRPYLYLIKFN